jgi:molybdopterin molybdotransferase
MKLLFQVVSPSDAWSKLRKELGTKIYPLEEIELSQSLGHTLAMDCLAEEELPYFSRSTVDGYAIRAADSFGVSEGLPGYLQISGKVEIGTEPEQPLPAGTAVAVATGSMLPKGADAVVMLEYTNLIDLNTLEINKTLSPGENVIGRGEDYNKGSLILPKGKKIRAQDIAGLAALGYTKINVYARPRVAIISTGDELISPEKTPRAGTIRDINSSLLAALVSEAGGIPLPLGIVPDSPKKLIATLREGLEEADLVLISGGSSVGSRDHTIQAINSVGEPGVIVHGLALKPGKPTAIGVVNSKPVFGLPGNPVSAFVVFELLVRPLLRQGWNLPKEIFLGQGRPRLEARLGRNVPSASGREEYVQVKLETGEEKVIANPVFSKSGHISAFSLGDGFIKIPINREGIPAGEIVEVIVYS